MIYFLRQNLRLVNALAYEACFRIPEGKERSLLTDTEFIRKAKENLVIRRDKQLDQLADKLRQDRVNIILYPILKG